VVGRPAVVPNADALAAVDHEQHGGHRQQDQRGPHALDTQQDGRRRD
jgi:hypothetical protein